MTRLQITHATGTVSTHDATITATGEMHDHGEVISIIGDGIDWRVVVRGVSDRG